MFVVPTANDPEVGEIMRKNIIRIFVELPKYGIIWSSSLVWGRAVDSRATNVKLHVGLFW